MYKFLAIRIHDGYLAWEEIEGKKYYDKVKAAYTALYGEDA